VIARAGEEVDPGKQRRLASGIPVVPVFDGYRAIAVLGVVMIDVCIISGFLPFRNDSALGLLAWGSIGQTLDMLFIISGFVIFLPAVVRGGQFGSKAAFAIRRVARLFPAYWTVLLIMLVLIAFVPVTPDIPFPSAFDIFLHLTTLEVPAEMFRNVFFLGFGINRALWTLFSEVCFYLLLPFVAAWYFRHPFFGLGIAAAVTSIWKLVFVNLESVSSFLDLGLTPATIVRLETAAEIQFPAWMFSIAMGMTCAWVFVHLRNHMEKEDLLRKARWVALVSFLVLCVFVYFAGDISRNAPFLLAPEWARHSPIMAIGFTFSLATLMLAISLCGSRLQRPFANRYASWIADNSVGIYMIHMVFISYAAFLLDLPQDGTWRALAIWSALIFTPTVIYGYCSARYIERPIRRRAQRHSRSASARYKASHPELRAGSG